MSFNLGEVLQTFPETWKSANTYFLDIAGGIIIDPGKMRTEEFSKEVKYVIATHGHFDHLMGLETWWDGKNSFYYPDADRPLLSDPEANASKLFAHKREFPEADVYLKDGDKVDLDEEFSFHVYNTPGHTPGSSCYLLLQNTIDGHKPLCMFSGDMIFFNSIGRTDLITGNPDAMRQSVDKMREVLSELPDDLPILSGHGRATTPALLRKENPFFRKNGL